MTTVVQTSRIRKVLETLKPPGGGGVGGVSAYESGGDACRLA